MNLSNHIPPHFKVLVVDDHPHTASLLARAISQLGSIVNVVSATSGHEALDCARDAIPHILITDMNMPDITGLELIETMHRHSAGRPIFSILITAAEEPELGDKARDLHVMEILRKPVHPERVCQIVSRALIELSRSRPHTELEARQQSKILIVDDEPDSVTLISRYLECEGYACITASNGAETLEQVCNQLPDLVLLDVNMPCMDGFDVLQEIRSNPVTQHIPVVLHSAAWLNPAEITAGLIPGPDDFITKPFDRGELLDRVRKKLRVKETEDLIRSHHRGLYLLPAMGRDLNAQSSREQLAIALLKHSVEALGAEGGHVVFQNPSDIYETTYRPGQAREHTDAEDLHIFPRRLLKIIHKTHQGFIVHDTSKDRRWAPSDFSTRSALVAPLFGQRGLLGILILVHEQKNYFNVEHQLLLQAIVSQATLVLENIQLKENERITNEGIATASHDLRTPITSIAGFIYLIQQAGPLNETQNCFLERIQHANANMSGLVENMMNLTKFNLGVETRTEEVDVTHLLWEVAGEIGFQAELKKQLLTVEKIEFDTRVLGDALQLRQALRNLIGNAVKYTPSGGAITLSLEHQSNMATIKIKDTGYGIPASDLPHIFDRFYRVRNNGHDHVEGDGLGLAIVKSIAEQHGGSLSVESEAGKGSCFTFMLPLAQEVILSNGQKRS